MFTVVTVDDEMMIKRTLKKLVEFEGSPFTVVGEAEDGGEALKLIEAHRPDLVITDIRMPVCSGLELVHDAQELRGDVPMFVILSGHDDFTYAQQALRYGVADYMLKPIKPDQLREVLGRVEQRLRERAETENNRRDRLWYCKSQAEPLAESLWLLNAEALTELLADIHREFVTAADDGAVRASYLDLLSLLDGALAEKSGGAIRLDRARWHELPERADDISAAVRSELDRVTEEIRQSRNWLSHQNMKRAAVYLQEHFTDESLSLQEVADFAGISASYFSRMFKEEHGISFIHYVTKLRMERARELLADPHSKTYEVAYAIGYQDYPHFAKVFKKMYGITPSDYKKRVGVEDAGN